MKVVSVALLIGLVVTISEGHSANRNLGLGDLSALTSLLAKAPAAVEALSQKFGVHIDVGVLVHQLNYLINVLEPILEPAALREKIKEVMNLLARGAKAFGLASNTDFQQLSKDLQAKLVPGLQFLLNLAKMVQTATNSLKL